MGDDAPRLLHVGGSGSLVVEPGVLFAERLPKILLPKYLEVEILGQILALEDERGRCRLSRADFAVALIDEAEQAKYSRQRISAAY
jgi:putative NADH-flavin reductase